MWWKTPRGGYTPGDEFAVFKNPCVVKSPDVMTIQTTAGEVWIETIDEPISVKFLRHMRRLQDLDTERPEYIEKLRAIAVDCDQEDVEAWVKMIEARPLYTAEQVNQMLYARPRKVAIMDVLVMGTVVDRLVIDEFGMSATKNKTPEAESLAGSWPPACEGCLGWRPEDPGNDNLSLEPDEFARYYEEHGRYPTTDFRIVFSGVRGGFVGALADQSA
jgi:hypothetical protein